MDRGSYAAIFAIALLLTARGVSIDAATASTAATHFPSLRGGISQQASTRQASTGQASPARSGATGQSGAAAPAGNSQQGSGDPSSESAMHSITVKFDYDFSKTPACTEKVTSECVQNFNVYDISGDKPYFLFSVPLPPNPRGMTWGITFTGPRLLFAVGRHRIGVSAVMPNGQKSPPRECKVIVEIKPPDTTNAPGSVPANSTTKPAAPQ